VVGIDLNPHGVAAVNVGRDGNPERLAVHHTARLYDLPL